MQELKAALVRAIEDYNIWVSRQNNKAMSIYKEAELKGIVYNKLKQNLFPAGMWITNYHERIGVNDIFCRFSPMGYLEKMGFVSVSDNYNSDRSLLLINLAAAERTIDYIQHKLPIEAVTEKLRNINTELKRKLDSL